MYSQLFAVKGKITNQYGEVLDSVLIFYEGRYTLSDNLGRYSLEDVLYSKDILFVKKGYHSSSIRIEKAEPLNDVEDNTLKSRFVEGSYDVVLWRFDEKPNTSEKEKKDGEQMERSVDTIKQSQTKVVQRSIFLQKKVIKPNEGESLTSAISRMSKVSGSPLLGEKKVVRLFGLKSKHTTIFLDDIPLNEPGQEFDISKIPSEIVDSIVVFSTDEESLSAGALAGIVKIYTKKRLSNYIKLQKALGSFGRDKTAFSASYLGSNFWILANVVDDFADNNFSYRHNSQKKRRAFNQKELLTFVVSTGGKLGKSNLLYTAFFDDYHIYLPGPIGMENAYLKAHSKGNILFNSFKAEQSYKKVELQATLGWKTTKNSYDNTSSTIEFYQIESKHSHNLLKADFQALFKKQIFSNTIGYSFDFQDFEYNEYRNGELTPQTIEPKSKSLNSVFAKTQLKKSFSNSFLFEAIFLNRVEFAQDNNLAQSLLLGSTYKDSLFANLTFAKNFSHPSYYDKYWKASHYAVGNPNLKSEESKTVELKTGGRSKRFYLEFVVNRIKLKNQISWQRFWSGWKPINIDKSEITNFQILSTSPLLEFVDLNLFAQRTLAYDRGDFRGKLIPFTPSYYISISLDLKLRNINFSADYNQTGSQWTTQDQLNKNQVKSYDNLDLTAGFTQKFGSWSFGQTLGVFNVLDKQILLYDVPQAGINWQGSISVNRLF